MNKKSIINICFAFFAIPFLNVFGLKAQEKNDSVNVAFGSIAKRDVLGAISTLNMPEILDKSYSTNSLDGIQSFVGGYNGNIWGQAPLVLVDGIPRNSSDLSSSEIASISILKDASSIVLYGSRAAKGVVLITTKRGRISPLKIDLRANAGLYVPKRYPKYLNAADYMTLYNEAYANDGNSSQYYSDDQISNTRAGTNPYRYPDIDFFSSDFLKKSYNRYDLKGEISGGNSFARYYTNLSMTHNNSLLKFGEKKNDNNFTFKVRTNLDMELANWLTASTNVVAVISDSYSGNGDFWGQSATFRPNWFGGSSAISPFVPISALDQTNSSLQDIVNNSNQLIDGKYLLGGTSSITSNVFGDMLSGGYAKYKNRSFLFDVSLKADLSSILKGLSFKTTYSINYVDYYSETWGVNYYVYQPTWSTTDDVITNLTRYGTESQNTTETVGASTLAQTMSFSSQFNYNKTIANDHHISAALLGWGYQVQNSSGNSAGDANLSTIHRTTNVNLGFQANYNYKNRYYADFSAAEVHSAKLPAKNRNAFSPTFTLGWRLSDESFFKNKITFVDDLKLTASYSNLHQDLDITDGNGTDYYLYEGYFKTGSNGGWYTWRDGNAGGWVSSLSARISNPDLNFIQRKEYRIGFDASLLSKLLTLNANYFIQYTNGLLATGGNSVYPSYFGSTSGSLFLPYLNFNKDKRSGLDFSLNLNKKIGQIYYSLGVAGMLYSSKAVKRDELYSDSYQYRAGKPIDSYWGYVCEGFFSDQADIDSHATQKISSGVKPGDLKYKDMNNDGIIDTKDQVNLGHNGWAVTPFTYGINLTMKWRNFTLFAMGTGQRGAVGFKNSSYYWINGTAKYSDVVWGRWTEATKNTATYPRLTTTSNSNNFQNSTFWMYKTNRFDLNRVQLTYDFNPKDLKSSFLHGLSVYLSGESLLTLSKERKLMETNVGAAPQCRYFNIGAKASF